MDSEGIISSKPVNTDKLHNFYSKNRRIIIICVIILVILIIFIIIVAYINHKNAKHIKEINRIIKIEAILDERKKQLAKARDSTTACTVGTYDNPRDCYFASDFKCHWDLVADRCNQI